jgi:carboxyl-terminal processing protease
MNDYLRDVLTLIRDNAYRADNIRDWDGLIASLVNTVTERDTAYDAIEAVLAQLQDRHSHFIRPGVRHDYASSAEFESQSQPHGRRLGTDVGYIELFSLRPGAYESAYADAVQNAIRALLPCKKWIVDLRRNGGGNMYPMLAGIGPILGEGVFGGFIASNGQQHHCRYERGAVYWDDEIVHQVENPVAALDPHAAHVAVLCSGKTASAGENTLIAFIGRPNTRIFGEPTAGLTIGNAVMPLEDGAQLVLAVSAAQDRTGVVYEGRVQPDVQIAIDGKAYAAGQDPVLMAALAWLG